MILTHGMWSIKISLKSIGWWEEPHCGNPTDLFNMPVIIFTFYIIVAYNFLGFMLFLVFVCISMCIL